MKKLSLILVFDFALSVCFAQYSDRLVISCFEFQPNYSTRSENMSDTYDVQISLRNVSNSPVFFWSWQNRWFTNFRFINKNIYFINKYVSDAPKCCLVLPYSTICYKGQLCLRTIDSKYLLKSQDISFLFYDALKYSREEFLRKDAMLINSISKKPNEFKIMADTIKCKKTVWFQLW